MDNRPVGVMDSGIGGLTVARYLKKNYPEEGILFLGDTFHNPYGEKTPEEITEYATKVRDFLIKNNVKMVLVACNTISFNTPESFYETPIPVIRMSMNYPDLSFYKKVAILATPATIATHHHKDILQKKYPHTDFVEIGPPGLANAIETGKPVEVWEQIIKDVIEKHDAEDCDAAILACTHFPFAENEFRKFMPHAHFIDPASVTVEEGMKILESQNELADKKQPERFYFTDDVKVASPIVKAIFGDEVPVEKITLAED